MVLGFRALDTSLGVLEGWEHVFVGFPRARSTVLRMGSQDSISGVLEGSEHVLEGFLGTRSAFFEIEGLERIGDRTYLEIPLQGYFGFIVDVFFHSVIV